MGPCCTSAPLSPLCRILEGSRPNVVCKKEEKLIGECNVSMRWIVNNVRCLSADKVEPSVGLYISPW